MSLRLAARRLGPAASSLPNAASLVPTTSVGSVSQRRHKWSINAFKGWGRSSAQDGKDSASGADGSLSAELDDPIKRREYLQRSTKARVQGNIFEDEVSGAQAETGGDTAATAELSPKLSLQSLAAVTDPDPRSRVRWQRKKVIQMVRANGQLTKEERLKMTERELRHKSDFMPTSLKKLVMLSRQIAGKEVDDAILQMRWSKKKFAAEVRYHLEEARDLAIAQRGMGLGQANGEAAAAPRKIQTKDGRWVTVNDPTRMYVAQSWIGRGPWRTKSIDYKGRGKMGLKQHPATSLTVLLKEDKTRVREHEERVSKKVARGPWVHLPNRKVYGQRPYYSW